MRIVVNGEERNVPENISVTELLRHLGVDAATVVVQRNEEIVSRDAFDGTMLSAADTLELVRFVGGG